MESLETTEPVSRETEAMKQWLLRSLLPLNLWYNEVNAHEFPPPLLVNGPWSIHWFLQISMHTWIDLFMKIREITLIFTYWPRFQGHIIDNHPSLFTVSGVFSIIESTCSRWMCQYSLRSDWSELCNWCSQHAWECPHTSHLSLDIHQTQERSFYDSMHGISLVRKTRWQCSSI